MSVYSDRVSLSCNIYVSEAGAVVTGEQSLRNSSILLGRHAGSQQIKQLQTVIMFLWFNTAFEWSVKLFLFTLSFWQCCDAPVCLYSYPEEKHMKQIAAVFHTAFSTRIFAVLYIKLIFVYAVCDMCIFICLDCPSKYVLFFHNVSFCTVDI